MITLAGTGSHQGVDYIWVLGWPEASLPSGWVLTIQWSRSLRSALRGFASRIRASRGPNTEVFPEVQKWSNNGPFLTTMPGTLGASGLYGFIRHASVPNTEVI